jgi:hypothetical protein
MKRFLITSTKFTGTAELLYDSKGQLVVIDCIKAQMEPDVMYHFKRACPLHHAMFATAFSSDTTIIEAEYEIPFDEFWNRYSKKINRKRAEAEWSKLNIAERVAAYYGIEVYDEFLKRVKVRQKLDPENYLKQRSWENEWR